MPTFYGVADPTDPMNPDAILEPLWATRTYQTPVGVTRDATGLPLAGCTVDLFRVADNVWMGRTISGADGTWVLQVSDPTGPFRAVVSFAGPPELAGVTAGTLVAL